LGGIYSERNSFCVDFVSLELRSDDKTIKTRGVSGSIREDHLHSLGIERGVSRGWPWTIKIS